MSMEGDGGQSIITILDDESDFLGLEYETNPLDGQFDQSIKCIVASFLFKHHAPSVLKAIDVFRLPKSIGRLNQ